MAPNHESNTLVSINTSDSECEISSARVKDYKNEKFPSTVKSDSEDGFRTHIHSVP
jgi:hypothetical protein